MTILGLIGGVLLVVGGYLAFRSKDSGFSFDTDYGAGDRDAIAGEPGGPPLDGLIVIPKSITEVDPNNPDRFYSVDGASASSNAFYNTDIWPTINAISLGDQVQRLVDIHGLTRLDALVYFIHGTLFPVIDPVLIRAVIHTESSGNPDSIEILFKNDGSIYDYSVGLMQIRTDTAMRFGPWWGESQDEIAQHLKQPAVNIAVGTKILAFEQARYSRHRYNHARTVQEWGLASYNAGTAFYNPARNTFSNEGYVKKVTNAMSRYLSIFPTRHGTIILPD